MAEIIAETDRLILRREQEADLAVWMAHLNTPEVTAHVGGPRTQEEVAGKFERMAGDWAAHGFSFMMVALRESGTLIGTCGIGTIDTESAPEELRGAVQIGWTLRADHWGQGYAIEAARAVLDFAFDRIGLAMIYAQSSDSNPRSLRLMDKLGMIRRADLDYSDPAYPPEDNPTIIYALSAADWRAQPRETMQ